MCGISGFFNSRNIEDSLGKLKIMSATVEHRGPDQFGYFVCENSKLFLAHQRLSIIDLSEAGQQPMRSACSRYVIAYNGEIYNFQELRARLESQGHIINWRGHSDTEVLLECISAWGLENTLGELNGMFAFALFDQINNKLYLARDRFGEKPLYLYSNSDSFAFASELKAIERFTSSLTLNASAVDAQLRYSYIPAPYSIYNEVFKLSPGTYLDIDLCNFSGTNHTKAKPFWSIKDTIEKGLQQRINYKSLEDAIAETENVLLNSVKQRMVSDVSLGAFLSGGIDSTCITALMQANSSRKIKTFSIGFYDKNYNEAEHAKAVANILGTEHHEMYLCPKDMLAFVPKLADIYDEPFADSSQLPTLVVSKFAKKHVTVALTGDAGDEVFCGYNRYSLAPKLVNSFSHIPVSLRAVMGKSASAISPETYRQVTDSLAKLVPKLKKYRRVGDNIHKLARVINFKNEGDLYRKLIQTWPDVALSQEVHDIATDIQEAFSHKALNLAEKMMWQDSVGYMQNDILTKVDRASMAVSLETRVPFLDNDVFQHAWSLPIGYKHHNGISKYPLRKIISKYIPNEIMDRPKSGFAVPIDAWLRNELRDWVDSLLNDNALSKSGLIKNDAVKELWQRHLTMKSNEQIPLWNILMFQQWLLSK